MDDAEVSRRDGAHARIRVPDPGNQQRDDRVRVQRRPFFELADRSQRFTPDARVGVRECALQRLERAGAHEAQRQRGFGRQIRFREDGGDIVDRG